VSARHVLGDHAADSTQGLPAPLSASRGGANVVFGDSSTRPGSHHTREIDGKLLSNSPYDGRGLNSVRRSRRRSHSSDCVRLRRRDDCVGTLSRFADDNELRPDRSDLALCHEAVLQILPGRCHRFVAVL